MTHGWGAGVKPAEVGVVGQADSTLYSAARRTIVDHMIRCQNQVPVPHEPGEYKTCNRLLAIKAGRPWEIGCPRCKATNQSPV